MTGLQETSPNALPSFIQTVCCCAGYNDSEEDEVSCIDWLKLFIADLKSGNPVRLAERGYPPSMTDSQRQILIEKDLAIAQWEISKLLRYQRPCRLGEGIEYLEHLRDSIIQDGIPISSRFLVSIFLGSAYSLQGQDEEAVDILRHQFSLKEVDLEKFGPINALFGASSFARSLRRLGRIEEAEAQERQIVEIITGPYPLLPSTIKASTLCPGETTSPALELLPLGFFDDFTEIPCSRGASSKSFYRTTGDQRKLYRTEFKRIWDPNPLSIATPPLEVDKGTASECWVAGCRVTASLSKCSRCQKAKYCGTGHQKLAWRTHKHACKG